MTIKDLIVQLNQLPQDQQIYTWDPLSNLHVPIKNFVLANAKISEDVDLPDGSSESTYIRAYLVKT